jgi:hypothetical protein
LKDAELFQGVEDSEEEESLEPFSIFIPLRRIYKKTVAKLNKRGKLPATK